jgi:RHS repeat-associated protein
MKMYFLHDDRLGTPQLATDSTQAVAWSANYQPFGYTSTGIALIVQNLRLPGQEFEVETGWNHNGFRDYAPTLGRYLEADPIGITGGARFYNAATGRFISEDPIGFAGGPNLYSFGRNNPTGFTDPLGLQTTVVTSSDTPVGLGPYGNTTIPGAGPAIIQTFLNGVSTIAVDFFTHGIGAGGVALADKWLPNSWQNSFPLNAVSDAPRTPPEDLPATPYGARPIQLFEGSRR